MVTLELSEQEKQIIEIVRTLAPFEEVRIVKDQSGRPDHFFVVRTQKVVISREKIVVRS